MISYFIVAHRTFTTNFSSILKSQFQVIFGAKIPFLWKWVHFRSVFCRTLPTVFLLTDRVIPAFTFTVFYNIQYSSNLQYSFSYTCLQMVAFEYFQYLTFLNTFLLHLHADSTSLINTSNGTLCKYLTKFL